MSQHPVDAVVEQYLRDVAYAPTCAEWLLEIADDLLLDKNKLGIMQDGCVAACETPQNVIFARIALVLKLRRAPGVVVMRAIVEDWSQERIVRELY